MKSLDWKDVSETDSSSFKTSTSTPWFGATMLLVGLIIGFVFGNFINV